MSWPVNERQGGDGQNGKSKAGIAADDRGEENDCYCRRQKHFSVAREGAFQGVFHRGHIAFLNAHGRHHAQDIAVRA